MDLSFSKKEEAEFQAILKDVMLDEKALRMKKFIQHGVVSTYQHCENVARVCYKINKNTGEKADMKILLTSAFLHDYFLYDWHEKKIKNKIHGFTHARTARKNAARDFQLNEKEQQIIFSHMWPLNLHRIPASREAWILCMADKYCSSIETMKMREEVGHYWSWL